MVIPMIQYAAIVVCGAEKRRMGIGPRTTTMCPGGQPLGHLDRFPALVNEAPKLQSHVSRKLMGRGRPLRVPPVARITMEVHR